ncbi:hypothetical protein M6B38_178640 [Iris pallida]|uniref:Uncharacterized protein n=1 Tax=Iris pallida TaxID=29817 RepID=A0AAX6EPC7_IRIPA|nr:hypothetical protein M6B38_178640 [Iris pallida]
MKKWKKKVIIFYMTNKGYLRRLKQNSLILLVNPPIWGVKKIDKRGLNKPHLTLYNPPS